MMAAAAKAMGPAAARRASRPQAAAPALPQANEPKRPAWTLDEGELEAMLERASSVGAARALDQHRPAAWVDQETIQGHLGCSWPTLKKLLDDGLPFVWMGEYKKFSIEEVDAWLRTARRQKAPKEE